MNKETNILDLPNEILDKIVLYLIKYNNIWDFLSLYATNKRFYNISKRYYIPEKIKYFRKLYHHFTSHINMIDWAASRGYLDIIEYLHNHGTEECTSYAMDGAAENGHLDVVKYLHHNRNEGCSSWAMDWAIRKGHLDVVEWLYHNRTEGWSDAVMLEYGFDRLGNSIEHIQYLIKKRHRKSRRKSRCSAC